MLTDLLNSSYFALFLIVALGFILGRIKIKGLSLDVSAVIFIALYLRLVFRPVPDFLILSEAKERP